MLLRSLTKHVKDQNWFAVWIDFAIVIVGVFIGIQVANWNDGRTSRLDYLQALDRAEVEVAENIAFIDAEAVAIGDTLSIARAGFDALLSCSEEPGASQKINDGIIAIRGTRGVRIRTAAITELTTNPAFLSEQSDQIRKRLSELRFYQQLAVATSNRFEPIIAEIWPSGSPTLSIQPMERFNSKWFGIDYEIPRYALELDVSIHEACTDRGLLKWFHTWENWQSNILLLNEKLRIEYQTTLETLQGQDR